MHRRGGTLPTTWMTRQRRLPLENREKGERKKEKMNLYMGTNSKHGKFVVQIPFASNILKGVPDSKENCERRTDSGNV